MLTQLSRHVFFPLWEIKDGARRRQHLRELSASQWDGPAALAERQWQRLREAVGRAYRDCAQYRESFARTGFDGTLCDWTDFRRLPVLTKRDIRQAGERLLSARLDRGELVQSRTGGSTGTALTVWFDEPCQQARNAAAMRSDRWAGWDIGMRVAAVWGNPPVARSVKQRLRSLLLDRTSYLDTMDLNEASVRAFAAQWRRQRPRILYGHAHSLYVLTIWLRRLGIGHVRPRGVIATSMMLLEPERRVIEQVLGCPVTNRYGCEEVGLIGCECERHDGLHLNVDHLVVEFLRDDGTDAAPGEEADIVVTDLVNRAMPLIRYRLEDRGVPSDRVCACGRGLPLMERVTGRQADFLKRPDGSLVAGVSLVERTLTAIEGIEQMQLVQDDLRRVSARVVRDERFDAAAERRLREALRAALGSQTDIEIRCVPALERTGAGKYRFAVCNV